VDDNIFPDLKCHTIKSATVLLQSGTTNIIIDPVARLPRAAPLSPKTLAARRAHNKRRDDDCLHVRAIRYSLRCGRCPCSFTSSVLSTVRHTAGSSVMDPSRHAAASTTRESGALSNRALIYSSGDELEKRLYEACAGRRTSSRPNGGGGRRRRRRRSLKAVVSLKRAAQQRRRCRVRRFRCAAAATRRLRASRAKTSRLFYRNRASWHGEREPDLDPDRSVHLECRTDRIRSPSMRSDVMDGLSASDVLKSSPAARCLPAAKSSLQNYAQDTYLRYTVWHLRFFSPG
jgi:hypothetical protein